MSDDEKKIAAEKLQALIETMPAQLQDSMKALAKNMEQDNGKQYTLVVSFSFGETTANGPTKTIHMATAPTNIGRAETRLDTLVNLASGLGFVSFDPKKLSGAPPVSRPADSPLH